MKWIAKHPIKWPYHPLLPGAIQLALLSLMVSRQGERKNPLHAGTPPSPFKIAQDFGEVIKNLSS